MWVATTFITSAIVSCLLCAVSATAPSPGSLWKKTLFLDDFNGRRGTSPSTANWIIDTGTAYVGGPAQWGTGEVEMCSSSTSYLRLDGLGNLKIIPTKVDGTWYSGRIETASTFTAPAGGRLRIEARIQSPAVNTTNGLGYWPAFWALGAGYRTNTSSWPAVGELDMMEIVNGASTVAQTFHCGTDPDGVCNEPDGLGQASACTSTSCTGEWHVYTAIINLASTPQTITFKVDGVAKYTLTETVVGNPTWSKAVADGHFVILDVAMGGSYPNAVAGMTTPTSNTVSGKAMTVDYVAVWST